VGVVVAVQAQRLTEYGVVALVASPTHRRLSVLAKGGVATGVAGLGSAVTESPVGAGVLLDGAVVNGAE
jgi:hypothetical protein